MSNRLLEVDPQRADPAKIAKAAEGLREPGAVAVIPTDTNYSLACRLGDRAAIERIHQLRAHEPDHAMTLLLPGFSSLGRYAAVDNVHFRMLKSMIPGPYTFILQATKEVPRAFAHPKRKTVGVRIPEQQQALDFIGGLGEPMVGTTLKAPTHDEPLASLEEVLDWVRKIADVALDVGTLAGGETTIIDLTGPDAEVLRQGAGDTSFLDGG